MEYPDWLTRRRLAIIGVVVAVVAAVGAVGATTLLSQQATVTVETGSGLTVRVTEQAGLPSGNPFGAQSFETGEANVSSPSGGEVTLEATPNRGGGGFVVLTQLDAGSGRLDVATPGSREIGLASGATASELRVNSTVNFTDNTTTVDARVSSSGGTTLAVNAAGLDTGVVAVDADSGAPLDAGVKSADGTARFEIPDGTHRVALQRGPSTLLVFNESAPTEAVTDDTGLRVRFAPVGGDGNEVVQRNVTNGNVSLGDLPFAADRPLVVTVAESNNSSFFYRRVPVESLIQQQEVYLLPRDTENVSTVRFSLTDRTGRFSDGALLRIEKPIQKDFDNDDKTETRYQTVTGDSFGTGTITVNLEQQERYRIRLVSPSSGEERVLGSFTPLTRTQTEELTVSQVALDPETRDTGVGFTASLEELDNSTRLLRAIYQDPTNETTSLEYEITRVDTDPNQTVVATTREDGPLGRIVLTEPVTANETAQFVVRFEYLRNGELRTDTVRLGGVRPLGLPGDPQVISLLSWVGLIAVTGLVVIRSPRLAALVSAMLASGMTAFGLISVPPVALGIAGATGLLMFISRDRA
jgi:hypothetical protein